MSACEQVSPNLALMWFLFECREIRWSTLWVVLRLDWLLVSLVGIEWKGKLCLHTCECFSTVYYVTESLATELKIDTVLGTKGGQR